MSDILIWAALVVVVGALSYFGTLWVVQLGKMPMYPPLNESEVERYQRWYVEGKLDLDELERAVDRSIRPQRRVTPEAFLRPYRSSGERREA